MLVRYFGGKAGVFAAAIKFDLALPSLDGMDSNAASETLIAHVTEYWDLGGSGGDLVALLRASVDHPEAKEQIISIFSDQLSTAVARVSDVKEETKTAALIASQILGLIFCRYVLDIPTLRTISRDDLIRSVGQTLKNYLADKSSGKDM